MEEPEEKGRLTRVVQAVTLERVLLAALVIVLAFDAYESHQTNLQAQESNRILKGRGFDRLYAEHAELLKRCGE